jgi:hypothetical protein
MNRFVRATLLIVAAAQALFLAGRVDAESAKPAKPAKIKMDTLKPGKVELDPRLGYVLVRIGPQDSPTDKPTTVAFLRIDENTGKQFWFATPNDIPPDFWRTMSVGVNTGRSFGQSDNNGVYLIRLFPGRWVINNVGTTCLTLGTYSFDVKQGEVADIGTLLTAREDGSSKAPELKSARLSSDLVEFGTLMNIVMTDALYVKSASDEPALPPEMAPMPRRKAELQADFRSENTCQGMINRAASLPPLGHQPPMTVEQAAEAISRMNPAAAVDAARKKREKETTATKQAKGK